MDSKTVLQRMMALMVIVVLIAGCSKTQTATPVPPTPTPTPIPTPIPTPVPMEVLEDFPLYPDAKPSKGDWPYDIVTDIKKAAYATAGADADSVAFYLFPSDATVQDVKDFYDGELSQFGWEVTQFNHPIESMCTITYEQDGVKFIVDYQKERAVDPLVILVLLK